MLAVFAAHSWPQSAVSLSNQRLNIHPFPLQFLTAFDPQPGAWLFMHASVTVSICLCSATLTFIFLIRRVTTYGLLDQTRPTASSEPTICPGAYSSGVINTPLFHSAVINTRRIHPTKRDTFNRGGVSPSSLQMLPLFHSQRCFESAAWFDVFICLIRAHFSVWQGKILNLLIFNSYVS